MVVKSVPVTSTFAFAKGVTEFKVAVNNCPVIATSIPIAIETLSKLILRLFKLNGKQCTEGISCRIFLSAHKNSFLDHS